MRKVQNGNRDCRPSSRPTLRVRPVQSVSSVALLLLSLIGGGLLWTLGTPVGATTSTYYVDCSGGNDNNAGTSTSAAWKSITRANKATLQPGDRLLLKRGCTWSQQLTAKWSGTASAPILISAYGSGDLPKLQDNRNGNVYVSGSYQTIEYLQTYNSPGSYGQIVTSCNNQPVGWVVGFNIAGASHNTIRYSTAMHEAIGVSLTGNANDNHILHNQIINNDGAWVPPSRGLRGGTGVNVTGTGNEIAYNHFEGNHTLCDGESISVELFAASNTNIHHNTTYSDRNFIEMGSKSTFQSSDNTIAYNVHTTGDTGARFVVTRGQGGSFGPVLHTNVFNNDVYYTGSNSAGVVCSSCGTDILRMQNNIIDVVSKAFYVGPNQGAIESNNIFWSPTGSIPKHNFIQNWNMSSTSRIADPKFVNPGGRDFHLQSSSPAIGAGSMDVVNAGYTSDLDGHAVPQNGAVEIGAYEVGTSVVSPPPPGAPETGHTVGHGFLAYWEQFGGLPVFGNPISDEFQENGVTVQYFERARFEWHSGAWPERYDVLLGLLGRDVAAQQGLLGTAPFKPVQAGSDANCTFYAQTSHRLCFGFRAYWQQHGGLAIFGYPISEEFTENGVTVQYFERQRFEYHPENPPAWQVEGGLVGREVYNAEDH